MEQRLADVLKPGCSAAFSLLLQVSSQERPSISDSCGRVGAALSRATCSKMFAAFLRKC